jgi:hypothetical protein
MTTLFTPTQTNLEDTNLDNLSTADRDYYNELVGEGKKFKTVQDLAKGKVTSDDFIERLKTELSELRTELRSRNTVEELLARTKNNVLPNPADNQEVLGDNVNTGTPSLKDLESLLDRRLTEREQLTARQNNLTQVKNALIENWGQNFPIKLAQVARENGYSQAMLDQMAQENPNAFYRLVDLKPQTNSFNTLPNNSISAERSLTGNRQKPGMGWSHWKARQKALGDQAYTVQEQQAVWNDLQKFQSEEDFYNS